MASSKYVKFRQCSRFSWITFLPKTFFQHVCWRRTFYSTLFSSIFALNQTNLKLEISLSLFVIAWIGQFIGHKIEGAKPSFFDDLKFLLIGPAWLIAFIYQKLGIKY